MSVLSYTMELAEQAARANGGRLHRHRGGYWTPSKNPNSPSTMEHYGTSTIDGLVRRGLAYYSDHRRGRSGEFPVEMTLIDSTTPKGESNDVQI